MNPLLYQGTDAPPPAQHDLCAGPLRATYEEGSLRRVRLGEEEIVRRIYFALRDETWTTIPARITNEVLTTAEDSFRLTFTCGNFRDQTEVLRWQCELTGDATGSFRFTIEGEVLQPVSRNRAGLCILHPLDETLNQPVTITHPDGSQTSGTFPKRIQPDQPFLNIAEMSWTTAEGTSATLHFEGDIFETEDQRNWSDASFKTYCTPQHLPMPVQLKPGDCIRQVVTLQVNPASAASGSANSGQIPASDSLTRPLPPIGLCYALDEPKLKTAEIEKLKQMALDHLLLPVDFSRPDWSDWLATGLGEARKLELRVILAITFTEAVEYELTQLKQAIDWLSPRVLSVQVFQKNEPATPNKLLEAVQVPLRALFPNAPVGAGSAEQFTDLNRNRPDNGLIDYVVYALSPQVHAFDNQTLIENIAAQEHTVRTARHFTGDKPVHVGPVTLRPRQHPEPDPRQTSLLAAGWLLGSLATLALAGAARVTYFDTKGPKGVLENIDPVTNQGRVFPAGLALMALAGWENANCVPDQTGTSLTLSRLTLRRDKQTLYLLASHSWEPQPFSLPETGGRPVQLWSLDETTAPASMASGELPNAVDYSDNTFTLLPFAVVGILDSGV